MFVAIISFILILTVLVLIHELGHFLTAKWFGVKVEEFGFGFPLTKPLFSKKIGETTYSFYPALIGGFVKLFGEDEAGGGRISDQRKRIASKDLPRAFFTHPLWQRFLIIFAGVFMNFILASVILTYIVGTQGIPTPGKDVYIVQVVKDTPAEKAGLIAGEKVISIDETLITSAKQLISYTYAHLGKQLTIKVQQKNGEIQSVFVTPRIHYPSNQGAMGVAVGANVVIKKYVWYLWPFVGIKSALEQSWLIVTGLGQLMGQLLFHGVIPQDVAGPIGMAQISGQIATMGTIVILSVVAMLSLNLAILNVLPIPALDGGRLLFLLFELILRRRLPARAENYANAVGMALLLILFAFITFHDVVRWVTGGSLLPR